MGLLLAASASTRTLGTEDTIAMNARISVVVLTHNRLGEVTKTVEGLLALPERPAIVVVDNGSSDGTVHALRARFAGVNVVALGANLGAAGRNHGVTAVETEYVAFSDDDTHWAPGALERAGRALDAAPSVAVLSGRVLVGEDGRPDPTCSRMKASPLSSDGLPGPALVGYMAGACVFRTGVFREVGGYEPRLFIGGEESLVSLDVLELGYSIVYCDAVTVTHHPSLVRDAGLRRRMLARNAALVAWLRLPLSEAVAASRRALTLLARERPSTFLRDSAALLADFAWAWRRRRVVSRKVLLMRQRVREAERSTEVAPLTTAVAKPDR
jgi:GT2 family glycosyltransferase